MNAILAKIDSQLEGLPEEIAEARRLSDLVTAVKLERRQSNLELLRNLLIAFREKRLDTTEIRMNIVQHETAEC